MTDETGAEPAPLTDEELDDVESGYLPNGYEDAIRRLIATVRAERKARETAEAESDIRRQAHADDRNRLRSINAPAPLDVEAIRRQVGALPSWWGSTRTDILALCDEVERLRRERDEARAEVERTHGEVEALRRLVEPAQAIGESYSYTDSSSPFGRLARALAAVREAQRGETP